MLLPILLITNIKIKIFKKRLILNGHNSFKRKTQIIPIFTYKKIVYLNKSQSAI